VNGARAEPETPGPITAHQIADELGAPRHTGDRLAARLKLGTWGRTGWKGCGYVLTPEEAEQLRAAVKQYLEERRRIEERQR
jgi:hypothetical protein